MQTGVCVVVSYTCYFVFVLRMAARRFEVIQLLRENARTSNDMLCIGIRHCGSPNVQDGGLVTERNIYAPGDSNTWTLLASTSTSRPRGSSAVIRRPCAAILLAQRAHTNRYGVSSRPCRETRPIGFRNSSFGGPKTPKKTQLIQGAQML